MALPKSIVSNAATRDGLRLKVWIIGDGNSPVSEKSIK